MERKAGNIAEKVRVWLKDPYNLALLGVMLFALIIRFHYFSLTLNQPLWWDEAEYMVKAKGIAFGTPVTGWVEGIRPILFPLISAIFLKLGLGELGLRFLFVLLSIVNIYLVYYIGKNLFSKKAGLIAAAIMSVSYIDLFYTARLLVNLPEISFVLIAYCLFIKSEFLGQSKKFIWFIIPILLLGTLIRFTVGLALIILFIYLLFTHGVSLFKEKDWYISALFGVILYIPYGIYSWIKFHNPIYVIASVLVGATEGRAVGETPFDIFMQYVRYLPNYTHWLLFAFFIIGALVLLFNLSIGFDRLREDKPQKAAFFLLLAFIIPLIYFGFFVNHFEDRYIAMALSILFIFVGIGLDIIFSNAKKYLGILLAVLIIAAVLGLGLYQMYTGADGIISDKLNTYRDLKDAGLWIKANSMPGEAVLSGALPEMTYYSERAVYTNEQNLSAELEAINTKNVKYIVISSWENEPQWIREYLANNPSEFKQVYQATSYYHGQQTYAVVFSAR